MSGPYSIENYAGDLREKEGVGPALIEAFAAGMKPIWSLSRLVEDYGSRAAARTPNTSASVCYLCVMVLAEESCWFS
jgi:hypothetical protein